MVIPFALKRMTCRGARNTGWNVNNSSLNLTTTDGCDLLESDLGPRRGEGRGRKHG